MKKKMIAVLFVASTAVCTLAQADNALTSDQLMKSIQNSVKDYATVQPDMARSISGLSTKTTGTNAQVTIQMNADGMSMSAHYICAPQGDDMACNIQQ